MMVSTQLGYAVTAGATAMAIAFSNIDANPSLYLTDKFFASERRLHDFFGRKTMWITGASSGIGAEMAMELSRIGVNLILSARSEERLQSVAEACREVSNKGNAISVLPLDVTCSDEDLESAVDKVLEMVGNGSLDFVVLNAGKGQLKPERMMTRKESQDIFQLNAIAPIALTQILLRKGVLQADRGKNLMVTSSVGGKYGLPLSASYAASKHALHGYFDSLQAECPWLRIDLVCPGPIDTAFHDSKEGQENTQKPERTSTRRELKMPASRCAQLMVSSFLVKGGGEHWIAEQPSLIGLYIKQFFPSAFQSILCKIGPLRIKAWQEGLNLYDPQTWKDIRKRK
jgi:dehydrogenase/reductase SDR family protein 7